MRSCEHPLMHRFRSLLALVFVLGSPIGSEAQDRSSRVSPRQPESADHEGSVEHQTASRLANPIPYMVSLPFQLNFDRGYGANHDGHVFTGKFQPIIPFEITKEWDYVTRTIIPFKWQNDIDNQNDEGFGAPLFETFFMPRCLRRDVFGIGPFFSAPALSGSRFGTQETGAGVSAVALWRPLHWTIGVLTYQSFDIGGSDGSGTANVTYWQPILSYVNDNAYTFTLNTESQLNWNDGSASNPMNLLLGKTVSIGDHLVQFLVGGRYYLTSSPEGATGFGGRAMITFAFP